MVLCRLQWISPGLLDEVLRYLDAPELCQLGVSKSSLGAPTQDDKIWRDLCRARWTALPPIDCFRAYYQRMNGVPASLKNDDRMILDAPICAIDEPAERLRDYWLTLEVHVDGECLQSHAVQCFPGLLADNGDGKVAVDTFNLPQPTVLDKGSIERADFVLGVCHAPSQRAISLGKATAELAAVSSAMFFHQFPAQTLPGVVADELSKSDVFPPSLLLKGMDLSVQVGIKPSHGAKDGVDADKYCLSSFGVTFVPILTTNADWTGFAENEWDDVIDEKDWVDYWEHGQNLTADAMALCTLRQLVAHSKA